MTGVEVAKGVGVSRSYLSDLEHGNRRPSPTVLRAFAHVLGLDANVLAREAGILSERAERWVESCPDAIELLEELAEYGASSSEVRQLVSRVKRFRAGKH